MLESFLSYGDKGRLADNIESLRLTYKLNAKGGEYTQGITRSLAGALGMKNSDKESIDTVNHSSAAMGGPIYFRCEIAESISGLWLQ